MMPRGNFFGEEATSRIAISGSDDKVSKLTVHGVAACSVAVGHGSEDAGVSSICRSSRSSAGEVSVGVSGTVSVTI